MACACKNRQQGGSQPVVKRAVVKAVPTSRNGSRGRRIIRRELN